MKIITKLIVLFTAIVTLTACSSSNEKQKTATPTNVKVTVSIKPANEKTSSKKVALNAKNSVMDALKKAYTVKEDNGFVTEINGKKQDKAKRLYWMYKINNKMAPKGAKEIKVKNGDDILFYQEIAK